MSSPIGIFDSGVGGLTVAGAVRDLLPHERLIYYADVARAPYGNQSAEKILAYSFDITRQLLREGAKAIIVACNTATSVAIDPLRQSFPEVPFVGLEPAVKPATQRSERKKVGILATELTLQSERFNFLVERYAKDCEVYTDPCIGLVPLIEKGALDDPATLILLLDILTPLLARGVDTVALGCTHYPLVKDHIQVICGPEVQLINPAPAAARQLFRLLKARELLAVAAPYPPLHRFYSSGSSVGLTQVLSSSRWQQRLIIPHYR